MRTTSDRVRGAKGGLNFAPKDRIDHVVFGPGTILEIDGRRTKIDFDESGTRTFVTSLVKLAVSDTPAPPRRRRSKRSAKASG